MRIGFFADQFLPGLDGVVVSMLNMASGLEELGHEVWFIVPKYPGVKPEREKVITVPSLPVPLLGNTRVMTPSYIHKKKIQNLNLDIVHSHNQFASGRLAVWAAKRMDLPHVTTIHTIFPEAITYYPRLSRVAKPLIQANLQPLFKSIDVGKYHPLATVSGKSPAITELAWRYMGAYCDLSDTVAVPSRHFKRKLTRLGVKKPIATISNSVMLANFKPKEFSSKAPVKIAAVGRLSPEKRQDLLIRAVSTLGKGQVELRIIGEGPEKSRYQKLARNLRVEDRVKFLGLLEHNRVVEELRNSDVGILGSYGFETQGLVLIEYMAVGLPVIYCDPELREVIGNDAGLLVQPSAKSVAAGMLQLINNANLRRRKSRAALKRSAKYDHKKIAEKIEDIYEKLV